MSTHATIDELVRHRAATSGASAAVRGLDRPALSYEALESLTRRIAQQLTAWGLERGDHVGIALPNGPAMATTLLGVVRAAVAAPLNPAFTKAEFAYYLEDLGAAAVVVPSRGIEACAQAAADLGIPLVRVSDDARAPAGAVSLASDLSRRPDADPGPGPAPTDAALVLHTSGTTARPKIVPLSHGNLCASASHVAKALALTDEDVCLGVMPLFHIHGIVAALLASLEAGAAIVCTGGFSAPHFLDWLESERPTWYTAVPTMHQAVLRRLVEHEAGRSAGGRLRFIRSSSASLPPSVLDGLTASFGVPVVEAYGMTEAAHQMTSNPLASGRQKPGSVGVPAGPEVAIVSDDGSFLDAGRTGEVVIRGPNVTAGYRGVPDRSAHFVDGEWFRTGDQGYFDADGYLFLTGRLKEIINRGGESIAPREVDEALLGHPEVAQAVAFSVPDERLGEEVAAAVVLRAPAAASETELILHLERVLTFAKIPKRILILDEIPKGPTGKIQRIGLAERLGVTSVSPAAPAGSVNPAASASTDAGNATATRLNELWCEVLRIGAVGPDDDFVAAGGDSLGATLLVLRVREAFGVDVPLMAFFGAATVRAQASLIDGLIAEG